MHRTVHWKNKSVRSQLASMCIENENTTQTINEKKNYLRNIPIPECITFIMFPDTMWRKRFFLTYIEHVFFQHHSYVYICNKQYYDSKVYFLNGFFFYWTFPRKNKDISDKRHGKTFLMHFECLLFYNFHFMNSNCGCCTQSSTQHLPQLTIIKMSFFFLVFYFLCSNRFVMKTQFFIAIIIIVMPHPINSFLAGNVEGQHTLLVMGITWRKIYWNRPARHT